LRVLLLRQVFQLGLEGRADAVSRNCSEQ
jgi:hypothetical protein